MQFIESINYEVDVAKIIAGALKKSKVVHLRQVPEKELFKFYDKLFTELGECIPMDEDISSGNKTGNKWIEIKYDPLFPMSYRHSDTRQPLHTDGSYESNAPDVNFFFCVEKSKAGGATTFIDSRDLVQYLGIFDIDLLHKLQTIPVKFVKGVDSKIKPIINQYEDDYRLNWNYFRTQGNRELCENFHNFLEDKIVDGGLLMPILLDPGEAVFFNDELVLHGRNSFIGNRFLYKGGFKWKSN